MMQMLPFEYSLELCPVLLVCGPLLTRYTVLHLSHYELPIILQTMHPPASNIKDTVLHFISLPIILQTMHPPIGNAASQSYLYQGKKQKDAHYTIRGVSGLFVGMLTSVFLEQVPRKQSRQRGGLFVDLVLLRPLYSRTRTRALVRPRSQ